MADDRKLEGEEKKYMVLINARDDRKERSEQLAQAAAHLEFDKLLLTGENVQLVKNMATKSGIEASKKLPIGRHQPTEQLEILSPNIG